MTISTTITKKNYELKLKDLESQGYFIEYKETKQFWNTRIVNAINSKGADERIQIVFLVGRISHRFEMRLVWVIPIYQIPERYRSSIHTQHAYALKCVPLEV